MDNREESGHTPINRPNTRSRTLSTGESSPLLSTEKRKRSPTSQLEGNMSKKPTSESDPNNQIMRALSAINAKFEKLPTVEHLSRLETDLHAKLEASSHALKQELRSEFRTEMKAQAEKMTDMINEVREQVTTGANSAAGPSRRNDVQQGRYLRARRSLKIWPVTKTAADRDIEEAVRKFFVKQMQVPTSVAATVKLDNIRKADQARNSRVVSEVVVEFADVEARDTIKSYASGLAAAKGEAGLRLDVPPCLKGSFKVLNEHGYAMVRIYGKEVKRNIKFDDTNQDLMMDIKLPTSSTWHNISIDQAREARRIRETVDLQNLRQTALGNSSANNALDRDKARALMLAISPRTENRTGNFRSDTGVVHIGSKEDWQNFESEDQTLNDSVEEILRGSSKNSRGGATPRT